MFKVSKLIIIGDKNKTHFVSFSNTHPADSVVQALSPHDQQAGHNKRILREKLKNRYQERGGATTRRGGSDAVTKAALGLGHNSSSDRSSLFSKKHKNNNNNNGQFCVP